MTTEVSPIMHSLSHPQQRMSKFMKDNRFSRDLQCTVSREIAFFVLYNKVFISSWQLINSMKTVGRGE